VIDMTDIYVMFKPNKKKEQTIRKHKDILKMSMPNGDSNKLMIEVPRKTNGKGRIHYKLKNIKKINITMED